jgi:hypothetical protein
MVSIKYYYYYYYYIIYYLLKHYFIFTEFSVYLYGVKLPFDKLQNNLKKKEVYCTPSEVIQQKSMYWFII